MPKEDWCQTPKWRGKGRDIDWFDSGFILRPAGYPLRGDLPFSNPLRPFLGADPEFQPQSIVQEPCELPAKAAVLDGGVVASDVDGRSNFARLHLSHWAKPGPLGVHLWALGHVHSRAVTLGCAAGRPGVPAGAHGTFASAPHGDTAHGAKMFTAQSTLAHQRSTAHHECGRARFWCRKAVRVAAPLPTLFCPRAPISIGVATIEIV
jgi:hypothetical protein